MDAAAKKTALRMIPYGLYVLTGETKEGRAAAATVNWVTQASFEPPLLVVGVKVDSSAHSVIKDAGTFGLNVLGKDQEQMAYTFFKPALREGGSIGGHACRTGTTGAPILDDCPAYVECELVETVELGDHSVFVGKVVQAGVKYRGEGRPDDLTLTLSDLGAKVFYGG